jgi:hypothetical protein
MIRSFFLLWVLCCTAVVCAQETPQDNKETLDWVQRRAAHIKGQLTDAINMNDQSMLLVRLMEAHREFESVALAGLYCPDVRIAAEQGRNASNWLNNYTRDKDLNACMVRAGEARTQAHKMGEAAEKCAVLCGEGSQKSFCPADLLTVNAELAKHDLDDGLASNDMHILSQKVEHARRIFIECQNMASSMENCGPVWLAATAAEVECSAALSSDTFADAVVYVQSALEQVQRLKDAAKRCK